MIIIYTLLVLIIFICGLAIGYIVLYNKLQHYTTKVDQAESIIDDTLRKRYDLAINAANIIEKSIKDKKKIFKELRSFKDLAISNFDFDRKLNENVELIKQVRFDYDELKENKELKTTINELKNTSEKLEAAKSFYNKYTNKLNDLIRKFPINIIAKMHNIEIRLFFDGKDMHDDIVDDFKL